MDGLNLDLPWSGSSPEEKADEIADSLREAKQHLDDGDPEEAFDAVEGIAEDTGCPMCTQIEKAMLTGIAFVNVCPEPAEDDALDAVLAAADAGIEAFAPEGDGS